MPLRLHGILIHLCDQRLDVVELFLAANPADEFHVDDLAVEIAREIEEMNVSSSGAPLSKVGRRPKLATPSITLPSTEARTA